MTAWSADGKEHISAAVGNKHRWLAADWLAGCLAGWLAVFAKMQGFEKKCDDFVQVKSKSPHGSDEK